MFGLKLKKAVVVEEPPSRYSLAVDLIQEFVAPLKNCELSRAAVERHVADFINNKVYVLSSAFVVCALALCIYQWKTSSATAVVISSDDMTKETERALSDSSISSSNDDGSMNGSTGDDDSHKSAEDLSKLTKIDAPKDDSFEEPGDDESYKSAKELSRVAKIDAPKDDSFEEPMPSTPPRIERTVTPSKSIAVEESSSVENTVIVIPASNSVENAFVHKRHTCDGCKKTPIIGTRYHATTIEDFDLCSSCYKTYDKDDHFVPCFGEKKKSFRKKISSKFGSSSGNSVVSSKSLRTFMSLSSKK